MADVVDVVTCWLASAPGHFRWKLNCVSVLLNLLVGAGQPWRTSPQRCVWLHCAVFSEPACLHDWTWPSVSLVALQNHCHVGRFTPFERGVLLGSYLYNLPLLIPGLSHIGEEHSRLNRVWRLRGINVCWPESWMRAVSEPQPPQGQEPEQDLYVEGWISKPNNCCSVGLCLHWSNQLFLFFFWRRCGGCLGLLG